MSIKWDDFKKEAGDFPDRWKAENIGDSVKGKITTLRVATLPDGTQLPSITIATATGEREVLASQSMLLRRLVETQPKIGDTISITYTQLEKLNGGRTLKHFDVQISTSSAPTADEVI